MRAYFFSAGFSLATLFALVFIGGSPIGVIVTAVLFGMNLAIGFYTMPKVTA